MSKPRVATPRRFDPNDVMPQIQREAKEHDCIALSREDGVNVYHFKAGEAPVIDVDGLTGEVTPVNGAELYPQFTVLTDRIAAIMEKKGYR